MDKVKNLKTLSCYCNENNWPRFSQWKHWIERRKPIAVECVKRIGGVYYIDLQAFQEYLSNATLDEPA